MTLSTESQTFHDIRSALESTPDLTREQGFEIITKAGVDPKEFGNALNEYIQQREAGKTDFVPGVKVPGTDYKLPVISPASRLAGQVIGGTAGAIKHLGELVLPEDIENKIEEKAKQTGKHIPDHLKKTFTAAFDPYHGDGLLGGAEHMLGSILEYANVYKLGTKGVLLGAKHIAGKRGKRVPKVRGGVDRLLRKVKDPIRRKTMKKMAAMVPQSVGFGAAMTLVDGPDEDFLTSIIEDHPEMAEIFEHLAVNPDDPEALQYLQSFLNNTYFSLGVGAAIGAPLAIYGGIRQRGLAEAASLAKTANKMKDSRIEVSESSLSGVRKALSKTGSFINENLTSRFGVDDTVLVAGLRNRFASKQAISDADGLAQDMMRTIKEEAKQAGVNLKTRFPQDHKKYKGLTFEESFVNDALAGNKSALSYLKRNGFSNTANTVQELRSLLDDLSLRVSDDLVKGKLSAQIKANRGVYLNRAYRIFDDPNFKEWNQLSPDIQQGAITYLNKMGIGNDDAVWVLKELMAQKGGGKKGLTHLAKMAGANVAGTSKAFLKRKDVPKDIRLLYGEIKDPYKNFARTYQKLSQAKAEADFMHGIRQHLLSNNLAIKGQALKKSQRISRAKQSGVKTEDFPRFVETAEAATRGYVPLRDVGAQRLGRIIGEGAVKNRQGQNPLENLYASPEYKKFLEQGMEVLAPTNSAVRTFMGLKAATQTAKTVLSSATHGRNTMGNVILMVANGYMPATGMASPFKIVANRFVNRSNKELGEYLGKLQELGIVDSSVKLQTLKKTASEAFNFKSDKQASHWIARRFEDGRKGLDKVTQVYGAEDDFFKIMHYEKTLGNLKNWNTGLSDDVLSQLAARQTRDLMPNYALVPKAMKWLRRMPVGDFVSWPAEVTRVTKNLAKQTYDDVTGKSIQTLKREANAFSKSLREGKERELATFRKELNNVKPRSKKARELLKNIKATENDIKSLGKDLNISKELRSGIQARGFQRLGGMTAAGLASDVLHNYTMNLWDISMDALDGLDTLGSKWTQGTAKYFLGPIDEDANGHIGVPFINLSPIDPFAYLKDPARMVHSALLSGKEMNDSDWNNLALGVMDKALGPFLYESMITKGFLDGYKELTSEREEALPAVLGSEKLGTVLKHVAKPFTPGFVDFLMKRMDYASNKEAAALKNRTMGGHPEVGVLSDYGYTMDDSPKYLSEYSREGSIAAALGIRPQRLDITAGMRRQLLPIIKDIEGSKKDVTYLLNNPNLTNPKEIVDTFIKSQEKRLGDFQELRNITQAYDEVLSSSHLKDAESRYRTKEDAIWYGLTYRGGKRKEEIPANLWKYMELARTNKFLPDFGPSDKATQTGEVYTDIDMPYQILENIGTSLEGKTISDDDTWWEQYIKKITRNK